MPNIIEIDGIIGWDVYPSEVSAQLKNFGGEPVDILFSSDGGYISDGLAIFNHIFDYSGFTTARIIGMAASMASYIPLAADKVIAKSNAVFMIHDALMGLYGNQKEHEKAAKILGGFSNMLADIYVKKTKRHRDEIRALMQEESYFFGSEILEAGFVDEIDEIEVIDKPKDDLILDAMLKFEVAANKIKTKPEDFNKIAAFLPRAKNMSKIIAGESLGAFLNREIDKKAGDDADERQSIISEMARAAGIEVDTVNKILSGSIICPPISRLRAFARALSVTISKIINAAEKDGCNYNEEENVMSCNIKSQATEPDHSSVKRSSATNQNPNEEKNMDPKTMTLAEFLAQNSGAKAEHEKALEAAKGEGNTEGIAAKQAEIDRVHPLISAEGASEALIKSGFEALKGVTSIDTFVGIAAYETRVTEKAKADAATDEQEGDITPDGKKSSTDGKIRTPEDLEAEKALHAEMKGKKKEEVA